MSPRKCLYCGQCFEPTEGAGDHVLPSGLFGEFEGDSTFRGCCQRCNNHLGRHEQVLSQGSPLGWYRWHVKPNLHRRRKRGSLRPRGSKGASAPVFTMEHRGRTLLVNPSDENPTDVSCVNQLVIRDGEGRDHHVRVFPNMTKERLKSEIDRLSITTRKSIFVDCEQHLTDHVLELLRELHPAIQIVEQQGIGPCNRKVRGKAVFRFDVRYFQALAKIAFHYYLMHGRRGLSGHEELFAPVREFIRDGGDPEVFFHDSGKRFTLPFCKNEAGQVMVPDNWVHVLALNEHKGRIVVLLQFFVGPEAAPPPIYITLGSLRGHPALPAAVGAKAHLYWIDQGRSDRFAGRVEEVPLTVTTSGNKDS